MKPTLLFIVLSQLALIPGARAQFSAGYGMGYFPIGMNQVHNSVSTFNNNPELDRSFGPLLKEGGLLPVYHGVNGTWSKKLGHSPTLKFSLGYQNLHNNSQSVRVNWKMEHYYHRMKSGFNGLYLGLENRINRNNEPANLFTSWAVRGYVANYRLLYSIGEGENFKKDWYNKISILDAGADIGFYLHSAGRARLFIHYSHSLMQYATVKTGQSGAQSNSYFPKSFVPNPSHFGIQCQIVLGRCNCNIEGADEEEHMLAEIE